jgi:pyruvate-ferredoxin/flavodoxin oxidoreductase
VAVDQTIANLHQVNYPAAVTSTIKTAPVVSEDAPEFVQNVTAAIMAQKGDELPVSAMPVDGTWPTATTQWEKRNIALEIPVWNPEDCLQCGLCNLVCPHAAIRMKYYDAALLKKAPVTFKHADGKTKFKNYSFTIQIAPEDCTGCGACVHTCPARNKRIEGKKAINMESQPPLRQAEAENYRFFLEIPDFDRTELNGSTVKESQLLRPLFEYSGACAGCGETPYVKLLTQLFGDRAVIANATGCSSIYGGNLPTTPYAKNEAGRGPAWNNSLFEDAAEFGFGFRLTSDKHTEIASELLKSMGDKLDANLIDTLQSSNCETELEIAQQRERIGYLRKALAHIDTAEARQLESLVDYFVPRSVWIIGGDGWAYDIGYGGLDHVLAQGKNVNVLVLDTGVYSNTGGQCSKATPMGAVAKFAAAGKPLPKKDLGMICMTYGNIYVAQIAMGSNWNQTVKAFTEAENYDGPSIIIAYSHCIAHGIDMTRGMDDQKNAVNCGLWPLFRFDPRRIEQGECPLQLDSKKPSMRFNKFAETEVRWSSLIHSNPEHAQKLLVAAQIDIDRRFHLYEQMAKMNWTGGTE